jgi:hypothetical protein
LATKVAQFYGLVKSGLHGAQHLFRGVKRQMEVDGSMNADERVRAYTFRSRYDYVWLGNPHNGQPSALPVTNARVFVVLVREEEPVDDVVGSIEHWTWVREATDLPGAPVDHETRYNHKIWSRP